MNFGPSFLGGVTAGIMLIGVNYVMPEPAFMVVRELSYADGDIILDRAIRDPDVIADFVSAVVDEETGRTICDGGGYAEFETDESRRKKFALDDYVRDQGCLSRLSGSYTLYTTWTPRDGRAPVTERLSFTVE